VRRVDKIKAWLENCCAYRDVFEHRNRQRHPNTCTWFLNTPQYCKWKSAPFEGRLANDEDELQTSWHERIVFVQGTPNLILVLHRFYPTFCHALGNLFQAAVIYTRKTISPAIEAYSDLICFHARDLPAFGRNRSMELRVELRRNNCWVPQFLYQPTHSILQFCRDVVAEQFCDIA